MKYCFLLIFIDIGDYDIDDDNDGNNNDGDGDDKYAKMMMMMMMTASLFSAQQSMLSGNGHSARGFYLQQQQTLSSF